MMACNKKENSKEYFSFDANGVHYNYPQDVKYGFGTSRRALFTVASSGSLRYFIVGSRFKEPSAPGTITFYFPGNNIPTQDTIILDGVNNITTIERFLDQEDNYQLRQPLTGRIIISERTTERLSGTFEFEVEQLRISAGSPQWTGNTLKITNGKFSIIPAQ